MPFKNFHYKLPEYEAITPQSHQSFNFRTLRVNEEERFRGSLLTPLKVTEHLNRCIYESISKRPESIKNYDDFLKSITIQDRECLLYALYHITYEEVRNYDVVCSDCEHKHPITVNISETFNFNPYPGKDILTKRVKYKLPVQKGVSVYIKQPTIGEEITALRILGNRPGTTVSVIVDTLAIDKIEEEIEGKGEPIVYEDRVDILDAYLSLPAKDRKGIVKTYHESFGQYGIDLKVDCTCPSCGKIEKSKIDLVQQFFRVLYES